VKHCGGYLSSRVGARWGGVALEETFVGVGGGVGRGV